MLRRCAEICKTDDLTSEQQSLIDKHRQYLPGTWVELDIAPCDTHQYFKYKFPDRLNTMWDIYVVNGGYNDVIPFSSEHQLVQEISHSGRIHYHGNFILSDPNYFSAIVSKMILNGDEVCYRQIEDEWKNYRIEYVKKDKDLKYTRYTYGSSNNVLIVKEPKPLPKKRLNKPKCNDTFIDLLDQ